MISATATENAAAKAGAKAGAKARRRESEESSSQTEAVLKVAADGRSATWTRQYRVEGELRTTTMREHGRHEIDAAELMRVTAEAVRLAAGRLRHRHGVPALSPDERDEYRSALVERLLSDCASGHMPERAKMTRAYLVKRAEGLVLNDPDRQHADADSDGADPEAIAAMSEARERDRHDRHDLMLNRGVDGTWPEIEDGCAIHNDAAQLGKVKPISQKAARAAAYLVAGGTVRGDWSQAWGTSEGYAATRLVPEGAAQLRDHLSALDQSPLYLAIQEARLKEAEGVGQDGEAARLWLARTMSEGGTGKARAVIERRWRVELDPSEHAPCTTRTDRRIVFRSDRSRTLAEQKAGWTEAAR